MKPKVYIASSVVLHGVPDEHRAPNGCKQYFIVCKTTSKKRLAYILNTSVKALTDYGCRAVDDNEVKFIQHAGYLDEVRYEVKLIGLQGWFTWSRPEWLNKRYPL